MIISLRRGIKPKKPQHVIKNCETCGSNVHTTTDNNDNEWFRKSEVLQAKKAEIFKTSKTESSSALRSKTPTKRSDIQFSTCLCARYQANLKESYLIVVKRIFREPFTRSLNMYKEYLAKFWYSAKALENSKVSFYVPTDSIYGEVRVNTFRNAIGLHYLPHSSEYV
nr:hypothetical protein [Tanacetum cinerariifolium]